MFRRLPEADRAMVAITIDGAPFNAQIGDSVAAAVLAAGIAPFRRTAISGAARAPYCMMGVCFDCLVRIDGAGNRQGCLVEVTEGMRIETQAGARELGH
jgi:predicted molibdopterin-dependent oxidoreductase YjgC